MIVLHAGLRGDALWVWGEQPSHPDGSPPTSPYDAGPDLLGAALKAAGLGLSAPPRVTPVIGRLPTASGVPVASSPLLAPPPPPRHRPALAPCTPTASPPHPAASVHLPAPRVGPAAR